MPWSPEHQNISKSLHGSCREREAEETSLVNHLSAEQASPKTPVLAYVCKSDPETPQLWILRSSWYPKPKPCLPRAEPGSCISWWCAGAPERGRRSFLLDSPYLCKGFSRKLAMTHCPSYPPVPRCRGHGSKPCQDGGSRAHSPSSLSQAIEGAYRRHSSSSQAGRGPWDTCRAPGQLPPWAVFGHVLEVLAAAASDPSPLMDLLAQFPVQKAIVQEGTARNTKLTLKNIPRFDIFPGDASWI